MKANLSDHVNRIHKKLKQYSCELCNYTSCTEYELKRHSIRKHSPKKAHRPDLDALMKEAQKDKMIVSIEKIDKSAEICAKIAEILDDIAKILS
jgi:uncharacterized Fe-S cluster-containing protein